MAKYTTEVRTICEHFAADAFPDGFEYASIEEVATAAEPKIFDFTYPIWEGGDIHNLNITILEHFYFREIGFETYGLWKANIKRKILERMPYWIKLYPTTKMEYDYTQDFYMTEQLTRNKRQNESGTNEKSGSGKITDLGTITETGEQSQRGNSTDNRTSTSQSTSEMSSTDSTNSTMVHSDFPQSPIYPNSDYASTQDTNTNSETGHNETTSSGTGQEDGNQQFERTGTNSNIRTNNVTRNTEDSENSSHTIGRDEQEGITRSQFGHNGGKSPTELMVEYRNAILDIYPVIMEELEEFFMQLY